MAIADPVLEVVEDLAERIQRSVAVDDAELNYLSHSTHRFGDEDQLRLRSISERQLTAPIRDYVMSMNLETLREPIFIPATHDHGFDRNRLLVPIRSSHRLVGAIWIIHSATLSEEDHNACIQAAERLSQLMSPSDEELEEADFERELQDLVSENETSRHLATEAMRSRDLFNSGRPVLSIAIARGDSAELSEEERRGLRLAWSHAAKRFRSQAFSATGRTHGFGLLELPPEISRDEVSRACESFRARASLRLPDGCGDLHWGVSAQRDFEGVRFAYRESLSAIRIGIRQGRLLTLWEDRPLDAFLDSAVVETIPAAHLPPLFRDTIGTISPEILDTASAYLDFAGSAARVSEQQHLHRATVYYRIKQFEKQSGLDLRSGRDRLLVHLWFQLNDRVED